MICLPFPVSSDTNMFTIIEINKDSVIEVSVSGLHVYSHVTCNSENPRSGFPFLFSVVVHKNISQPDTDKEAEI